MDIAATQLLGTAPTSAGGFYTGQSQSKDPKAVGAQFEAMFYRMILKSMRESSLEEEGIFNSYEYQEMRQMQDNELAQHLGAQGKLGIMDMVEEYMEKQKSAEMPVGLLKDERIV